MPELYRSSIFFWWITHLCHYLVLMKFHTNGGDKSIEESRKSHYKASPFLHIRHFYLNIINHNKPQPQNRQKLTIFIRTENNLISFERKSKIWRYLYINFYWNQMKTIHSTIFINKCTDYGNVHYTCFAFS